MTAKERRKYDRRMLDRKRAHQRADAVPIQPKVSEQDERVKMKRQRLIQHAIKQPDTATVAPLWSSGQRQQEAGLPSSEDAFHNWLVNNLQDP